MNFDEYTKYDALGLAELVDTRQVTAKELAQIAAEGVAKVNPALNAVIEVFEDRVDALDQATIPEGPFRGVPFFIKDLGPRQKGRKQDGGSRLTEGYVADYSHFFTEKMERSGLNIMGRTTCPEYGVTGTTESILTGATTNPWNTKRIAGGSSGGSASIVAAGVVPMAHSNDGGGSTRIPAAVCGNVGMKHSRGRISYAPDGCDLSFPIFSEGVNAHTVRDVAAFLDAVHGPAPGEPIPFVKPERSFLEEVSRDPGKLKIACSLDDWGDYGMDAEIKTEMEQVASKCESLGHHVEMATPPLNFNEYVELFKRIWVIDIAVMLDMEAQQMGRSIGPDTVEPITLKMYEAGRHATAAERLGISFGLSHYGRALGQFYEQFDLVVTPTLARATPELGSDFNLLNADLSLDEWFDKAIRLIPYTPLNNFTGTPAISIPLATHPDGMPLGMHFMAPIGREDRLLQIAGQLERAYPWIDRQPAIHVAASN